MKATLTVLGSGTSMGVPTIGCDCAVCTSADPHDRRTRPSIMVQWDGHTVLIDTTPDFREQAIREGINKIDAVLYTHGHADHILGLDDVRPLSFPRVTGGGKIPLFATENTAQTLRNVFRYIFEGRLKCSEPGSFRSPSITATIPSRPTASARPLILRTSAQFPRKP
jgi:phosphoribosyl 1,2-cyclic phosphate phosphodiesterase